MLIIGRLVTGLTVGFNSTVTTMYLN